MRTIAITWLVAALCGSAFMTEAKADPVLLGVITTADLPFSATGPAANTNPAPNGSLWNLDLAGFPTPCVDITIKVDDAFPSVPDDFNVFFDCQFLGNTFDASLGPLCVAGQDNPPERNCPAAVDNGPTFALTVARDGPHQIGVDLANWYFAGAPTPGTWYDITVTADESSSSVCPDVCVENCDNGIDDDADNLTDCDDPDCANDPACLLCTVDLIADGGSQETAVDVGDVTITPNNDGTWTVSYATSGNWWIQQTHLDVACGLAEIPQTGGGNPKVGRFDYLTDHEPLVQEFVYVVGDPSCCDPLFAAHAKLLHLDECVDGDCRQESAWGDGTRFPGRSWATYSQCDACP